MKRVELGSFLALVVAFGICAVLYTYWQQKIAPADWALGGVSMQPALAVGKILTAVGYASVLMLWGGKPWIGFAFFAFFTLISVTLSALVIWGGCKFALTRIKDFVRKRLGHAP